MASVSHLGSIGVYVCVCVCVCARVCMCVWRQVIQVKMAKNYMEITKSIF